MREEWHKRNYGLQPSPDHLRIIETKVKNCDGRFCERIIQENEFGLVLSDVRYAFDELVRRHYEETNDSNLKVRIIQSPEDMCLGDVAAPNALIPRASALVFNIFTDSSRNLTGLLCFLPQRSQRRKRPRTNARSNTIPQSKRTSERRGGSSAIFDMPSRAKATI